MINLRVEPHISPLNWGRFLYTAPKYSIALDGYVIGESKFNKEKIIANFNHHERVNRLATKATCSQVLMAIRMGLLDFYRDTNNEIQMNIFVNDCDEDVCLSCFLLKHGYMFEYVINPNLNRLVSVEDMLDATSGAYPFPKDSPILKELAWIFDPYYRAKFNGLLNTKKPNIYEGIINDVEHRIQSHIIGKGDQLPLDTKYEIISKNKNWVMVEEIGIHARTGMMSDGIKAFVSVRSRNNGTYNYVIGKISPFINFDIDLIFKKLNEIENTVDDKWGGSDIIGGSPRVNGSKLKPEEVEYFINEVIKK